MALDLANNPLGDPYLTTRINLILMERTFTIEEGPSIVIVKDDSVKL